MKQLVDSNRIVSERNQRGWSQQQLAEIAGVSLRTIQRLEGTGRGSMESLRALATALDLGVADLVVSKRRSNRWLPWKVAAPIVISGVLFTVFTNLAAAEDELLLDYVLHEARGEDESTSEVQFRMAFDKAVAADIPGVSKIEFLAREFGDTVELRVVLYEYVDLAESRLIGTVIGTLEYGEPGVFVWSREDEAAFRLEVNAARVSPVAR